MNLNFDGDCAMSFCIEFELIGQICSFKPILSNIGGAMGNEGKQPRSINGTGDIPNIRAKLGFKSHLLL